MTLAALASPLLEERRHRPEREMDFQEPREFVDGELIPGTRFRVIGMIGQGGMGRVYDVVHVELEKRFVLKALLRDLTERPDLVARLRNEWRALGQLEHPNIVNVTDAGTTGNGVPFYVMERLEGETLAARLRQPERIGLDDALRIALSVLEGLSAAHQIGIVHRDVKPPNIFLTVGNGVKLLDFGIAKIRHPTDPTITSQGYAIGTPRYMSPEQARGEHVDGRADLYATGMILFEMITGQCPFEKLRDPREILMAHIGRLAPRLRDLVADVPAELDDFVASLLAKDPRCRPSNARLAADLLRRIGATCSAQQGGEAALVRSRRGASKAAAGSSRSSSGAASVTAQSTLLRFSGPTVLSPSSSAPTPGESPSAPAVHRGTSWAAGGDDDEYVERASDDPDKTITDLGPPDAITTAKPTVLGLGDGATERPPVVAFSEGLVTTLPLEVGARTEPIDARKMVMGGLPVLAAEGESRPDPTLRLDEPGPSPLCLGELPETHTQIPLADPSALSATPPPVVPVTQDRSAQRTRPVVRHGRWAWFVAVAAASFLLAVMLVAMLRARWAASESSQPSGAAAAPKPAREGAPLAPLAGESRSEVEGRTPPGAASGLPSATGTGAGSEPPPARKRRTIRERH